MGYDIEEMNENFDQSDGYPLPEGWVYRVLSDPDSPYGAFILSKDSSVVAKRPNTTIRDVAEIQMYDESWKVNTSDSDISQRVLDMATACDEKRASDLQRAHENKCARARMQADERDVQSEREVTVDDDDLNMRL